MERVAIFAALGWECNPILRHLRRIKKNRFAETTVWRGEAPASEVWLIKTAVGEQRAATAAQAVRRQGVFDLFLSTGCAGALLPEMRPGDLTIATAVIGNASGSRFETDPGHRERARAAAERAVLRTVVGSVLCSPHALATATSKRDAAASSGSVAVEMEGAAIGACALEAGIPFAAVRSILDCADADLPEFAGFVDPQTGKVNLRHVARHIALHPGVVPQLLALQRMRSAAQESLERFFGAWLAG